MVQAARTRPRRPETRRRLGELRAMTYYLANFINVLFQILTLAIFARVLLSWFPISPENPFVVLLNEITEPILRPLRRIVPSLGMLDITPIVALVLLQLIQRLLLSALY
jgi:YggT family protein